MKVEVKTREGVVKTMDDRYARVLAKMGRVTYLTRDMRAVQPAVQIVPSPEVEVPAEDVPAAVAEAPAAPEKRKYVRKAKAKE